MSNNIRNLRTGCTQKRALTLTSNVSMKRCINEHAPVYKTKGYTRVSVRAPSSRRKWHWQRRREQERMPRWPRRQKRPSSSLMKKMLPWAAVHAGHGAQALWHHNKSKEMRRTEKRAWTSHVVPPRQHACSHPRAGKKLYLLKDMEINKRNQVRISD